MWPGHNATDGQHFLTPAREMYLEGRPVFRVRTFVEIVDFTVDPSDLRANPYLIGRFKLAHGVA